jgi:DNA-binding NtrC family response regulator
VQERSILVLDDDIELMSLYRIVLQRQGYEVIAFSDPLLALEYFKINSSRFSLIVTDLRMPIMTGIEFASKVREIDKEIKIWLITAFVFQDIKDNPLFTLAKFEKIIEKPVSTIKLVDMVKSIYP